MRRRLAELLTLILLASSGVLAQGVPAHASFPGTNGKIAFASDRTGDSQIFTANADGQNQEQITFTASGFNNYDPAWSQDGKTLAYESPATYIGRAIHTWTESTGSTEIPNHELDSYDPTWSPDGAWIGFVGHDGLGNHFIYKMKLDGSEVTKLSSGPRDVMPDWSPDGRRIVYTRLINGHSILWQVDVETKAETELVDVGASSPSFSPDGTHIAYSADSKIYTISSDGTGTPEMVVEWFGYYPSWSPDGSAIAFTGRADNDPSGVWEIYTVDLASKQVTRVTNSASTDMTPAWGKASGLTADRDPVILVPGILGAWDASRFLTLTNCSLLAGVGADQKFFSYFDTINKSYWWIAKDYEAWRDVLKSNGYVEGKTLFFFPYWGLDPISNSVDRLAAFVDQVLSVSGRARVDLVGHSEGGVVARGYVSMVGSHKVGKYITFGTPHRGAPFGWPAWDGGELDGLFTGLPGAIATSVLKKYIWCQPGVERTEHGIFHWIQGSGHGVLDLLPTIPYLRDFNSSRYRVGPCSSQLNYPVNAYLCGLFSAQALDNLRSVTFTSAYGLLRNGARRPSRSTVYGFGVDRIAYDCDHTPLPFGHQGRWTHGNPKIGIAALCDDNNEHLRTDLGSGDGTIPDWSAKGRARQGGV